MGFIEDFYRGDCIPIENLGFSDNPEYKELLNQVYEKEDTLLATLNDEQIEQYKALKSIRDDINSLESERLFTFTFRLACRFIWDIYDKK